MKKLFASLVHRLLSPGEIATLRKLKTERQISNYHRQGLAAIRKQGWEKPRQINLGSGTKRREGFLNVDVFPGGDLTLDLRRPLPFASNCCELIISEHCFEHLEYPETIGSLLGECLRILRPGGLLRFSVPDTEWPLLAYAQGREADYFRACREEKWDHPAYCTTRLDHINFHFRQGDEHRYAYDEETARALLERVGFTAVRRASFDAAYDSPHRKVGSLFMSGQKPGGS